MIANSVESADPGEPRGAAPKRARGGARLRSLAIGAFGGLVVAIVAAAGFMIFARPAQSPRLTEADYQSAVARWEKLGPASYDLDLELAGNRPGTIHVQVRDGEVTHMVRDGVEPTQRRTWYYWSVPGMFDTIGEELEMARDPAASFRNPQISQMVMWAEFDPTLGYPRKYDRVVLGGDFEVHWRVTRFQAFPEKN